MARVLLIGDKFQTGGSTCDGCSQSEFVLRIGKVYLCAKCLRELAAELDREYGR